MSDRIAVMNRGVIEQVGSPEDVYERPRTTFVAGFIGVSNLIPARVERVHGEDAELRLDLGVTVRTPATGLDMGERCHAVVRPEKLELRAADDAAPDGRPSVEGVVESSQYLGTANQVGVRLADGVELTVLVPNADEAARRRLP